MIVSLRQPLTKNLGCDEVVPIGYKQSVRTVTIIQSRGGTVKTDSIPLSSRAQLQIEQNWEKHWGGIGSIAAIIIFCGIGAALVIGVTNGPWRWVLASIIPACLLNWLAFRTVRIKSFRRELAAIHMENEHDYHRSQELQVVLDRVGATPSTEFSVVEEAVSGEWRPFRVERAISQSLRGEIIGDFHANYWLGGQLGGRLRGQSVPNLVDSSSILFLQGDQGTLRALIPSPGAIRELVTRKLETWFKGQLDGSYTRKVLDAFAIDDEALLKPISHPQVLDGLDAACQLGLADRPTVRVIGQEIQPGVVMATALEVDNQRSIFVPTGLFQVLAKRLEPFIGPMDKPVVLEAVQAN